MICQKTTRKCSDNITYEAYASTASPHDLDPADLTELMNDLKKITAIRNTDP